RKKAYKKNNQGCQYHHYYIRMSHLRQDLWIQDRTIQPPEHSPVRVRSGRHHRPRWTTTSKQVCLSVCGVCMFSTCSQGVSSTKNPNRKNMQKQNILLSVRDRDGRFTWSPGAEKLPTDP